MTGLKISAPVPKAPSPTGERVLQMRENFQQAVLAGVKVLESHATRELRIKLEASA